MTKRGGRGSSTLRPAPGRMATKKTPQEARRRLAPPPSVLDGPLRGKQYRAVQFERDGDGSVVGILILPEIERTPADREAIQAWTAAWEKTQPPLNIRRLPTDVGRTVKYTMSHGGTAEAGLQRVLSALPKEALARYISDTLLPLAEFGETFHQPGRGKGAIRIETEKLLLKSPDASPADLWEKLCPILKKKKWTLSPTGAFVDSDGNKSSFKSFRSRVSEWKKALKKS